MTRLLLVRHGETAWNHDGRLQGQTDVELSDLGREQARRLHRRLADEPLVAAYTSDLRRCTETAAIALGARAATATPVAGLREIHLGDWQGYTWVELRARIPDELAWVEADVVNRAPPNGESRGDVQRRMAATICDIAERQPDGQVLVVSHGAALRALLCWALGADLRTSGRIELYNCALSVLELHRGRPTLVCWNDVGHLAGLVEPATRRAPTE